MSHDARPGRRIPQELVLALVLVLVHPDVDRPEHSSHVLESSVLEGLGTALNFRLMWGRQEGGFRRE